MRQATICSFVTVSIALVAASGCGTLNEDDGSHPAGTPIQTELSEAATELAAGGPFATTDQAERMVEYQLLRPDPEIIDEYDESGLVDVFAEVGIPRVRQGFRLDGKSYQLSLTQEPETYPESPPYGKRSTASFGQFRGTLIEYRDQIEFTFSTGAQIRGTPIRASVHSLRGYTRDEIESFVESLSFPSDRDSGD